jgi:hypothetical protein
VSRHHYDYSPAGDNFVSHEKRSMVGSFNEPRGPRGEGLRDVLDFIPALSLNPVYRKLTGRGAKSQEEFHQYYRDHHGGNYGVKVPPGLHGRGGERRAPSLFGNGNAVKVFGGDSDVLPPNAFRIPVAHMQHQLHDYKRHHRIPSGSKLPLDHTIHLLRHGAKHGTKGGFLPFAALLPLMGSALAAAGPSIASGLAGAASTYGLKKLFGNGVEHGMGNGHPPIRYHRGRNEYIIHGDGWKDVFKTLLKSAALKARDIWQSEGVRSGIKGAAEKARDALIDAAKELFTTQVVNRFEKWHGGLKRRYEEPTAAADATSVPAQLEDDEGNAETGTGYHRRAKRRLYGGSFSMKTKRDLYQ